MEEAIELARHSSQSHPDRSLQPARVDLAGEMDSDTRQSLLAVERNALSSTNPRLSIREAILQNATLAMQLDAIAGEDEEARQALITGYQPGMGERLEAAAVSFHVAWYVLRTFARWKFDDAVASDWFHNYVLTARPYVREKVRLAREAVLHVDVSASRFAAIYDTLLAELQQKIRSAPSKKRFVRPDLP
jgi:hypothetical protein